MTHGTTTGLLAAAVLAVLPGCGSAPSPAPVSQVKRAEVSLGECAFLAPADPGWISEIDPVKGTALFTKVDHPTIQTSHRTTIQIHRLQATDARLSLSSAQQAAALLSEEEKQVVQKSEGGVRYWIRGMRKGQKTVGGKEVQFIRYQTGRTARVGPGAEGYLGHVSYYLYFPENYRARHIFYSFRIDEYNPAEKEQPTYGADSLEPVIGSLRLK